MPTPDRPMTLPAWTAGPRTLALVALLAIAACATVVAIALQAAVPDGGIRSDLTIAVVLGATLGCAPALRARDAIGASLMALSGSAAAVWVAFAVLAAARTRLGLDASPPEFVARLAMVLGCSAASTPLAALGARARRSETLDAVNRLLTWSGAWLLVVELTATGFVSSKECEFLFRFSYNHPRIGVCGDWAAVIDATRFGGLAAALALALLVLAVGWDRRRLVWLRRVHAGRDAGWRLERRTAALAVVSLPALLGAPSACDGVLVRHERFAHGAFRETRTDLPVAITPLDPRVRAQVSRRRTVLAVVMALIAAAQTAIVLGSNPLRPL